MSELLSRRTGLKAGVLLAPLFLTGCGKAESNESTPSVTAIATPEQSQPSLQEFSSPHNPYSLLLPDNWERVDAVKPGNSDTIGDQFQPKAVDGPDFPNIVVFRQPANLNIYALNDYKEQAKFNLEEYNREQNFTSTVDSEERSIAGYQAFIIKAQAPQYGQPTVINEIQDALFLIGNELWSITLTNPLNENNAKEIDTIFQKALDSFTVDNQS